MYRPDSRILQTMLGLAACACLAVSTASAALIDLTPQGAASNSNASVSLADLISGQVMGVKVGDKEFTGFSYSRIGDMPDAANVRVLGFRDTSGNWGVSFHGAFLDLPGGSFSDVLIRFVVEVSAAQAAEGWRISDAHLFIGGVGVGGQESLFLVDEDFAENDALLEAYVSTIGGTQQVKTKDSAVFPLVTKLNVTKDILAIAAAGNFLPARATAIDQSFSQELIPEPASMALLGLSSLAIVRLGRRRS